MRHVAAPAAAVAPPCHASAVAWCGRGVLLLGRSGAGKSSLMGGLLTAGGYLVADDLVDLRRRGAMLLATGVAPRGLIELRGNGIFRLATVSEVPVNLCVELVSPDGDQRLPERRTTTIAGCDVPVLRVPPGTPEPVAGILMALLGRRRD